MVRSDVLTDLGYPRAAGANPPIGPPDQAWEPAAVGDAASPGLGLPWLPAARPAASGPIRIWVIGRPCTASTSVVRPAASTVSPGSSGPRAQRGGARPGAGR